MKISREQAEAFIEALTGYDGTDANGEGGHMRSPAAMAHLEAVLGLGKGPTPYKLFVARRSKESPVPVPNAEKACLEMAAFAEYLHAVAFEIRSCLDPKYWE